MSDAGSLSMHSTVWQSMLSRFVIRHDFRFVSFLSEVH